MLNVEGILSCDGAGHLFGCYLTRQGQPFEFRGYSLAPFYVKGARHDAVS